MLVSSSVLRSLHLAALMVGTKVMMIYVKQIPQALSPRGHSSPKHDFSQRYCAIQTG